MTQPKDAWQVGVTIENLSGDVLELAQSHSLDGLPEPRSTLPALLERNSRLEWHCAAAGAGTAVLYERQEVPDASGAERGKEGEQNSAAEGRRLVIAFTVPPASGAPSRGVLADAVSSAGSRWRGGAAKSSEPTFVVAFSSLSLSKSLAGAPLLADGRAPGIEWIVVRREEPHIEVRLRLLPDRETLSAFLIPAPGGLMGPMPSDESVASDMRSPTEEEEDELDESGLNRAAAFRKAAAALDAQAAELERLTQAQPLDPARLRELPTAVRVDLALALLAILLERRRVAFENSFVETNDGDSPFQAVVSMSASAASAGMCIFRQHGPEDKTEEVKKDALAVHVERVYRALVAMLGFADAREARKMADLCNMYLPGHPSVVDQTEVDAPSAGTFCAALREACANVAPQQSPLLEASAEALAAKGGAATAEAARTEPPSRQTEEWSMDDAYPLCRDGEDMRFLERAWLLERDVAPSLESAVDGLNQGVILCPEAFCVVYSAEHKAYYVLSKAGRRAEAVARLGEGLAARRSPSARSRSPSPAPGSSSRSPSASWSPTRRRASPPDSRQRSGAHGAELLAFRPPPRGGEAPPPDVAASAAAMLGAESGGGGAGVQLAVAPTMSGDTLGLRGGFAEGTKVPQVWLVLRQVLALAISSGEGVFDSRMRAVLLELSARLGVPPRLFARWESEIGGALFEALGASRVLETQKKDRTRGISGWKAAKIGAAAVVGGGLLAVTGGLAAPALAAGLATAGTSVATAASLVGLAAPGALVGSWIASGGLVLTSLGTSGAAALFGATGMGLTGWKLSTRWGRLEEFDFVQLTRSTRRVTISVEVSDRAAVKQLDSKLESGDGALTEDAVVPCAVGSEIAVLRGSRCYRRETSQVTVEAGADRRSVGMGSWMQVQTVRFSFEHEVDQTQGAVHVALFVTGWLPKEESYSEPWREAAVGFFPSSGHLALKWEKDQLTRLNHLCQHMLTQEVAYQASSFWLKSAVAGGIAAGSIAALAVTWPIYLINSMASLDNAWLVVAERAREAGQCLAHILADKHAVGQRPVTLIGHSMGARVIFYCLLELYRMQEFHVIDDVVLLGTPVTSRQNKWIKARSVVSGRLINCYYWKDWILAFLYRYLEWGISVAGLSAVTAPGVENVNVSGLGVKGHQDYPSHIADILARARLGERFSKAEPPCKRKKGRFGSSAVARMSSAMSSAPSESTSAARRSSARSPSPRVRREDSHLRAPGRAAARPGR